MSRKTVGAGTIGTSRIPLKVSHHAGMVVGDCFGSQFPPGPSGTGTVSARLKLESNVFRIHSNVQRGHFSGKSRGKPSPPGRPPAESTPYSFLVLPDLLVAQGFIPILTIVDCNDAPQVTTFTAI